MTPPLTQVQVYSRIQEATGTECYVSRIVPEVLKMLQEEREACAEEAKFPDAVGRIRARGQPPVIEEHETWPCEHIGIRRHTF